jgi:MATE family multidrug resistance protein
MSDLSVVLRHALTVLAGQLAVMAYGVTDTIVAGRHAQASLAALSIGSALFVSVYVSLQGVLQALLPIWAEQRGAHQPLAIGRSLRQALYLCALASALGMAVLLAPGALLRWAEVPLSLQDEVTHYLAVLAFGLPPALLFRTYCTLNQALGHPLLVTWLQVLGLVIKIPLSIWFTFGGAGLPAQGAVGCAWATLVVACCQCALAVWLLRTQSLYTPLQLWQRLERPDPAQLAAFMRLGLPAGLAILVEVTSFTLMALLIARQGTLAAASHQIAANLTGVIYMVPLSLGIATSTRVSYWRGAGDEARAAAVAWLGLRLTATLGVLMAATLWLVREPLAALYSPSPAVVALAASLLGWVALAHLGDALQALVAFVLRCYRVTLGPLLIYCALLWGAGLGGGYVLAYHGVGPWRDQAATPAPFWAANGAALAVTAALLIWLLARTLARAQRSPAS